ncbi:MAG: STAS domain-containing protein [Bdellovibrionales bacterium]|nr:STAS domain-containing protein [Bdellovibrionales bacterium]
MGVLPKWRFRAGFVTSTERFLGIQFQRVAADRTSRRANPCDERSRSYAKFFTIKGEAMDEYVTEIEGNKGIIRVTGDLDSETSGEALRQAFNGLYDQGKRTIVLDLSNVQIINSYGIGKVLMCYKRLKSDNGTLMVKPLGGFVKETFELLMLDKLLPVDE